MRSAMQQQYCKYMRGTCVKPRKSEPDIKVGICSVGYKGEFLSDYTPVILGGADVDCYPTEEEFVMNIVKKGISDKILDPELFGRLYF